MGVRLGCIADDFTGGTDLAGMLATAGMRTVQVVGVPSEAQAPDADAVVVSLKSRTCPADEAVAASLAALAWLRAAGCLQVFFKICSTFDSTPRGNIGPVADALLESLGAGIALTCPAFPANGRTVYQGHLFVGDALLSDSGMRDHPLTPMTDANLVRVLQAQTPHRVGLVDHAVVSAGADAIAARLEALRASGCRHAIADAITDADLFSLATACAGLPLLVGGSGLAQGIPANFGIAGGRDPAFERRPTGRRAIVSGSCSVATNAQVLHFREAGGAAFRVDPVTLAGGADVVGEALAWARPRLASGPVLVYATATPDEVRVAQASLGAERAGQLVESALAAIAEGLVDGGVDRLIVAGGETSGAVVQRLGLSRLRVGPTIDPGVPWMAADGARAGLFLALKSGNFGSKDFFTKAWDVLGKTS
jgi:uncharacterized protein YgbK (DUF1537 family)